MIIPNSGVISVAPLVDVTTRHFRYLIRLLSKKTQLYTPMLVAEKIASRKKHFVMNSLLRFHPSELPVVAQLGGDDPHTMVPAAIRCEEAGYSGINLNLGCPARSAQAGNHGAMLMKPNRHDDVASLLQTMTSELTIPVSVKLRIGVDNYEDYPFFRDFVQQLHEDGGVNSFVVHARKALLGGIVTTRQNRLDELVPLRYEYVYKLKEDFPHLDIELNGGVKTMNDIKKHINNGVDGVMMGRLARDDPFFFSKVDSDFFGLEDKFANVTPLESRYLVLEEYAKYASQEQLERGKFTSREMLLKPLNQLFEGLPVEKKIFASFLRTPEKNKRPELFGDEILAAVEAMRNTQFSSSSPTPLLRYTPKKKVQCYHSKNSNNPNNSKTTYKKYRKKFYRK